MSSSIIDIETKIGKGAFDNETSAVLNILLSAANDWPVPSLTLADYEFQVRKFVGSEEVTLEQLVLCLRKINLSNDAWRAESLTQAIEAFWFFEKGKTLEEIIAVVEQKV